MTTLTNQAQLILDAKGNPAFAVIPFAEYERLIAINAKKTIPNTVVNYAMDNQVSAAKAWREHFGLTQAAVAETMGISQSAYAQLEAKPNLRKSSREKIAKAMGLSAEQLDF